MPANTIAQAIDVLGARLRAEPETARVKSAPAVATLVSGLVCETKGPNGAVLRTDMPSAVGGTGSAPNPGWLMRASLASCSATMIATQAARLGVTLRTLEVTVECETDMRGMLGLEPEVSAGFLGQVMKVRIASEDATPEALEGLVRWAAAHSPVGCTVGNGQEPELKIEVVR